MNLTLRLLSRPVALAATVLGLSLAHLASAAETYNVNFTPPWKAGQTYTIKATGSQSANNIVMMGAQKAQEQNQQSSATLEADAKALEVYANGGLRKAQFTVLDFRTTTNTAPSKEALPKGAVIVAERVGEEINYTVDGKAASPEQTTQLKLVISLDEEKSNDQLVFGTDKPVAIGETWSPDPVRLKETLGKELGQIRAINATMRLDAITGTGDAQIAQVSGNIVFDGIQPQLPPGLTPKSGKFEAKLTGQIPARRKAATRNETLAGSGQFVATAPGPQGNEISLTVNLTFKQEVTLTFP